MANQLNFITSNPAMDAIRKSQTQARQNAVSEMGIAAKALQMQQSQQAMDLARQAAEENQRVIVERQAVDQAYRTGLRGKTGLDAVTSALIDTPGGGASAFDMYHANQTRNMEIIQHAIKAAESGDVQAAAYFESLLPEDQRMQGDPVKNARIRKASLNVKEVAERFSGNQQKQLNVMKELFDKIKPILDAGGAVPEVPQLVQMLSTQPDVGVDSTSMAKALKAAAVASKYYDKDTGMPLGVDKAGVESWMARMGYPTPAPDSDAAAGQQTSLQDITAPPQQQTSLQDITAPPQQQQPALTFKPLNRAPTPEEMTSAYAKRANPNTRLIWQQLFPGYDYFAMIQQIHLKTAENQAAPQVSNQ